MIWLCYCFLYYFFTISRVFSTVRLPLVFALLWFFIHYVHLWVLIKTCRYSQIILNYLRLLKSK